jgi:hypothetical protein
VPLARGRRNAQEKGDGIEAGGAGHDGLERGLDDFHVLGEVRAEERAQDDAQGDIHHVVVNVARFAGLPRFGEVGGLLHGDLRIARDAFAVKRGIAQAALASPEIAVAGEQAVAKELGIGARGHAFDEVAGLAEQDLFDVQRVEQDVNREIHEAVEDDIAVLAGPAQERARGIAAGHERGADPGKSTRAGRPERGGVGCCCACGGSHGQGTPLGRKTCTHDTR